MAFDDPFAGIESPKEKPSKLSSPRHEKGKQFEQPLDISKRDVYKATGTGGSVMHGNYYQLTTRLQMKFVEQIKEWASALNMTQQDLQRWCFYRGLQALEEGERPEFEEVIVQNKLKPPK